jgi:hypothetical protein
MVGVLSLISVIGGVGIAAASDYAPAHVAVLERCGGGLLLAGLALLGAALGGMAPIVH